MNIYQLKITLQDISPPIWRRVQVPAKIRLDELHDILQIAMGWEDGHLHAFTIANKTYGIPDPDFADDIRNEHDIVLEKVAGSGDKFNYEYDFGDGWRHKIKVEKVLPAETGKDYPVCLAGARACPPEDCGGPWGYQHLLEILNDPGHEEHEEMKEWAGEDYNPEYFDADAVNTAL